MQLDIITIFPEYFDPLRHALLGKAIERGQLRVTVHNLRSWTEDVHQSVDDSPMGGGPGMVMKPQVWGAALDDVACGAASTEGITLTSAQPHRNLPRHDELHGVAKQSYSDVDPAHGEDLSKPLLIVPTPAGVPFTQDMARAWSNEDRIVFACGRYEGIDQRVIDEAETHYRVREVSIGDYVLIGGEVAVLVITESLVRLIPGVLGNTQSHQEDSFSDGLLEGPSYTKPQVWRGRRVPEVLTSGHHQRVNEWRRHQSLARTQRRRPDLITRARTQGLLTPEDEVFLADLDTSVQDGE